MEYKSLYDHLGRAAGGQLGKQVAEAAVRDGVKIQTRQVSNPKYEGEVMLYPSDWLTNYFSPQPSSKENLPF
jgi:hypothetical protein